MWNLIEMDYVLAACSLIFLFVWKYMHGRVARIQTYALTKPEFLFVVSMLIKYPKHV